jgi:hypothetical protein
MSRQAKPDGVDVLHYRLYTTMPHGNQLKLSPAGGLTLAVRWPSETNDLEMAVSHASIQDAFVRSTGWNKAVGRFLSPAHRICVPSSLYSEYFVGAETFGEKCCALHFVFFNEPEEKAFVNGSPVTLEDFIAPEFWYDSILHQARLNGFPIWLSRTSNSSIERPDGYRVTVSPTWPCIKFW